MKRSLAALINPIRQEVQALYLLFNNLPFIHHKQPPPLVCRTPSGTGYDLYEPNRSPHGTVILVYGFDLPGEKDPRLVRFAYACKVAGLRTITPHLAGLKSFRFDDQDLEALVDLIIHLNDQYHQPIGIIGFSTGGSYALLTGADARTARIIDPLIVFSPYFELEELKKTFFTQRLEQPKNEREWDHFIWTRMVMAYRNLEKIDLCPKDRSEFLDFSYGYCEETIQRKIELYHRILKNLRLPDSDDIYSDLDTLQKFSLTGKLQSVHSRVMIFHDPADNSIPKDHAYRISRELEGRSPRAKQRILVSPLISHVTPRYSLRLKEIFTALSMLGELFAR